MKVLLLLLLELLSVSVSAADSPKSDSKSKSSSTEEWSGLDWGSASAGDEVPERELAGGLIIPEAASARALRFCAGGLSKTDFQSARSRSKCGLKRSSLRSEKEEEEGRRASMQSVVVSDVFSLLCDGLSGSWKRSVKGGEKSIESCLEIMMSEC